MKKVTLCASLLLSASTSIMACSFPSFSAHYQLLGKDNQVIGHTTRALNLPNANRFVLTSNTAIHVMFIKDQITLQSKGYTGPQGLRPTHIQMTEKRKNQQKSTPVKPKHFDIISYPLQMRFDLLHGAKLFVFSSTRKSRP